MKMFATSMLHEGCSEVQ